MSEPANEIGKEQLRQVGKTPRKCGTLRPRMEGAKSDQQCPVLLTDKVGPGLGIY